MMNKLILGRYIPGNSLIHRLDPRAKLLTSFYFIGVIFFANNWQSYLLLGLFTLFCIYLSKVDFGFFLRGVSTVIVVDIIYCCFASFIYLWWTSVLAVGRFSNYSLWGSKWYFYLLPVCVNYIHVYSTNINNSPIGTFRCD